MSESTALSDYRKQLAAEADDIKRTLSTNMGSTISTKGKQFTMPDGRSHPGPLRAIILDYLNYNLYYPNPFNAQNIEPPTCWAFGKYVDELAPPETVANPEADACKPCPNFQFGSAPNGRGKACRQTVRLALIEPDPTDSSEIMLLSVSPTALKAWSGYVNTVKVKFGTPPATVVTEIGFNPNETYPALTFGNPVPHENLDVVQQLRPLAQDILASDPRQG